MASVEPETPKASSSRRRRRGVIGAKCADDRDAEREIFIYQSKYTIPVS